MTWHVKSTTTAKEGAYTYDVVQRLNDSRFPEDVDRDVSDIRSYIKMGVLGQAFQADEQVVLLQSGAIQGQGQLSQLVAAAGAEDARALLLGLSSQPSPS